MSQSLISPEWRTALSLHYHVLPLFMVRLSPQNEPDGRVVYACCRLKQSLICHYRHYWSFGDVVWLGDGSLGWLSSVSCVPTSRDRKKLVGEEDDFGIEEEEALASSVVGQRSPN